MANDDDVLTALDATILRRLGQGDTATALACDLGVPFEVVIARAGAIRVRLGVTSTAAAAVAARERGLL
jgi:DNA-binding CsgD family transcriptional regulator